MEKDEESITRKREAEKSYVQKEKKCELQRWDYKFKINIYVYTYKYSHILIYLHTYNYDKSYNLNTVTMRKILKFKGFFHREILYQSKRTNKTTINKTNNKKYKSSYIPI